MNNSLTQEVVFILVEDNPGHVQLFKNMMVRGGFSNPLIVFEDGRQALDHIMGRDSSEPVIVILDLNLPLIHGSELIRKIREVHHAESMPIIVVSTSMDQKEVGLCSELGSQGQIRKPFKIQQLLDSIDLLGEQYSISSVSDGKVLLKNQ